MNLAAELLRDYLAQNKITQTAFAVSCKTDQSLVSKVIDGKIPVSACNLSKLMSGLKSPKIKLRFLVAHLHDQIPTEHVHEIVIQPAKDVSADHVYGINPGKVFDNAILQVVAQLPTQTKGEVYQFLQALRSDPMLRAVFRGLVRYIPQSQSAEGPSVAFQGLKKSGEFALHVLEPRATLAQRKQRARAADRSRRKLQRATNPLSAK